MTGRKYRQGASAERAAATPFYVFCLLPILLVVGGAGSDLAGWTALRDRLQLDADRRALYASGYLPDVAAAESYLKSAAAHDNGIDVDIGFPEPVGGSVRVTVSSRYAPAFLGGFVGSEKVTFRAVRTATASLQPVDLHLFLPDGPSLTPLSGHVNGDVLALDAPWGDAESWPASGYFSCGVPPTISNAAAQQQWAAHWNESSFRRSLTQGCFNPVYSAVKIGAIGLVDSLRPLPDVRVAVSFLPGGVHSSGMRAVRRWASFIAGSASVQSAPGGFFRSGIAEAAWFPIADSQLLLSDESCVLFSHPESAFDERYALRTSVSISDSRRNATNTRDTSCSYVLTAPMCGRPYLPQSTLSSCYRDNRLTLREAIYWHAAQLTGPRRASLFSVFRQVLLDLKESGTGPDFLSAESRRGKLASYPRRELVIVLDSLIETDCSSASKNLANELLAADFYVSLIVFDHRGLTSEERNQTSATFACVERMMRDVDPLSEHHHLHRLADEQPFWGGLLQRTIASRARAILRK